MCVYIVFLAVHACEVCPVAHVRCGLSDGLLLRAFSNAHL